MKIEIKKVTKHQCAYTVTRDDQSVELITLDTKTYLLHDICHYAVEKNLGYAKGFWGMLSAGYAFKDLFGKDNPDTAALRFIEQIVGPVQSVFLGNIPKQDFSFFTAHLHYEMTKELLDHCLSDIGNIMTEWESRSTGQHLTLEWNI